MVTKEIDQYTVDCNLLSKNVTVEDAGKYKVTARNDLGESNATITLNFDSKATKPLNTIIYQFCTETHNVKEKSIFVLRLKMLPKIIVFFIFSPKKKSSCFYDIEEQRPFLVYPNDIPDANLYDWLMHF